jgi:hypothetical protein
LLLPIKTPPIEVKKKSPEEKRRLLTAITDDVAGEPFGGEPCDGNRGRQQQANLDLERFEKSRLLHPSVG